MRSFRAEFVCEVSDFSSWGRAKKADDRGKNEGETKASAWNRLGIFF